MNMRGLRWSGIGMGNNRSQICEYEGLFLSLWR